MFKKTYEYNVIQKFENILGLKSITDGTIVFYHGDKAKGKPNKPDGYYFLDGVVFILDAKAINKKFSGQLESYLQLDPHENKVGFKYNGKDFECWINNKKIESELEPKNASYYKNKYFKNVSKQNLPEYVEINAKKLADMFRDAGIDKQKNVPFIGAVMLAIKFSDEKIIQNNTKQTLQNLRYIISTHISDQPVNLFEKREYINECLSDKSLQKCKFEDLCEIIQVIEQTYNFINIEKYEGHDIMNQFLKIFRHWNSANANEQGEVFTPDHIAQLMYRLIDCSKNDIILDPTCGSGTFLTNSLINMWNECKSEEEKIEIKQNHLIGFENKIFNVTLAGINMMLHGDGASQIWFDDCFKLLPKFKSYYNKVLMNPPFSQKIPELKFVYETLNNMKDGGLVASILPVSSAIGQKFKELRKILLEKHHLLKIITLPSNLFQPNAGTNTCIMVFKAHEKHINPIEQYDFSDDGFVMAKHIGRIDINNKCKTDNFFKQEPKFKNITYKNNWLLDKKINWYQITKLDFMKTKLDFMLINKSLYDEVLNNCGELKININVSNKQFNFKNWKEGKVSDILERIKGLKSISNRIRTFFEGNMPVITNTALNNGIGKLLNINDKKFIHDGNCLSYGAKGGKFFYQKYPWASTDHVHMFINKNLNEWNQMFICTLLNKIIEIKGGWGTSLESNILNETIMYPVNKYGLPDWEYMEKYIKNKL